MLVDRRRDGFTISDGARETIGEEESSSVLDSKVSILVELLACTSIM